MICIDEKSKQLIRDSRAPLPLKAGAPAKLDYEYGREGNQLFTAWNAMATTNPIGLA